MEETSVKVSGLLNRRLEKLEKTWAVGDVDYVDIVLWDGMKGGLFGHAHYRIPKREGEFTQKTAG
jgi:hypothetical protein